VFGGTDTVQLPHLTAGLRAKAGSFPRADAGNLPVRFDEREQQKGPSQTGLRWRGESQTDLHRETTVAAPTLLAIAPLHSSATSQNIFSCSFGCVAGGAPLVLEIHTNEDSRPKLTAYYFGTDVSTCPAGSVARTNVPLSFESTSSLPPSCRMRSFMPRNPTPRAPSQSLPA